MLPAALVGIRQKKGREGKGRQREGTSRRWKPKLWDVILSLDFQAIGDTQRPHSMLTARVYLMESCEKANSTGHTEPMNRRGQREVSLLLEYV